MMLSEEESPLTPTQTEYISMVLARVEVNAAVNNPNDQLILTPLLDKMKKALKLSTVNEVDYSPTEDWTIITGSRLKHKKTGHEIPANMWGDVLEKVFLQHKIHFEFDAEASAPKYVVFFKIFNE